MNGMVAGVQKLLRRTIPENIDLQIELSPVLEPVHADQGQLEQVVLNLAINAGDAMPQGGRLHVATDTVDIDEAWAHRHPPMPAGRYVRLTVSDTGMGMTQETQAHIFEPFFTTKERGKGTGLGLATVYGIVKQSDGFIWVTARSDAERRSRSTCPSSTSRSSRPFRSRHPRTLAVAHKRSSSRKTTARFAGLHGMF